MLSRDWLALWTDNDVPGSVHAQSVTGQSVVVVLPVPDFSMPYNVCCFCLVVLMTFISGGISLVRTAKQLPDSSKSGKH